MFPIEKKGGMEWIERLKKENKQVNYLMNKVGYGI